MSVKKSPSAGSLKVLASQAKAAALAGSFVRLCARTGVPIPVCEHAFALDHMPPRKWRFDFAWPAHRVALESEGGVWSSGAHTRAEHFLSDMEKYNAAALHGWRVFRTVPGQLLDLSTLRLVGQALGVTVPEIGQL